MADIKICDRCRKELTYRRTIVSVKPIRCILGVEVYTPIFGGSIPALQRTGSHTFELCDECANGLGEFLNYVNPNIKVEETSDGNCEKV